MKCATCEEPSVVKVEEGGELVPLCNDCMEGYLANWVKRVFGPMEESDETEQPSGND